MSVGIDDGLVTSAAIDEDVRRKSEGNDISLSGIGAKHVEGRDGPVGTGGLLSLEIDKHEAILVKKGQLLGRLDVSLSADDTVDLRDKDIGIRIAGGSVAGIRVSGIAGIRLGVLLFDIVEIDVVEQAKQREIGIIAGSQQGTAEQSEACGKDKLFLILVHISYSPALTAPSESFLNFIYFICLTQAMTRRTTQATPQ